MEIRTALKKKKKKELLWRRQPLGDTGLLKSNNPCLKHQPKKFPLMLYYESKEGSNCIWILLASSSPLVLLNLSVMSSLTIRLRIHHHQPPSSMLAFPILFHYFCFFLHRTNPHPTTPCITYSLYNVGPVITGFFCYLSTTQIIWHLVDA